MTRIVLGGACGSDVHITSGEAGVMPFPIILGHEGIGRIEKLGGIETDYAWLPNGLAFFRLRDGADPLAVAALGCVLPTVLRGFDRCGPVRMGEAVVVQGVRSARSPSRRGI